MPTALVFIEQDTQEISSCPFIAPMRPSKNKKTNQITRPVLSSLIVEKNNALLAILGSKGAR